MELIGWAGIFIIEIARPVHPIGDSIFLLINPCHLHTKNDFTRVPKYYVGTIP